MQKLAKKMKKTFKT